MSMWRPWGKSSPRKSDNFEGLSPTSIFRCSSFKDIENLCIDPDSVLPEEPNSKHLHRHHNDPQQPSTPRRSIFHRVRTANTLLRHWAAQARSQTSKLEPISEPDSEDPRVVVYYTSLRVVRSTFEACRTVLSILQGFRVDIDERDVAMDSGFMSELRERLGSKDKPVALPRVFIGGRYVGGAEEVLQLNEIGELKKLLQGVPPAITGTCGTCGGYKFILCAECNGSHKIFSHKNGALRSCAACNENGLIRCPRCCCPTPNRPILPQRNAC
uniref:Glutaredoxin domain-containing protein n=2 Tax=Opuntia streptacantha TaxID=393608 RepID=A0A7C9AUE7_OPUST